MLSGHGIPIPPLDFYEAVADRSEEIRIEAISEAIAAGHDDTDTVIANVRVARRFLERFGDDLFLATEQADDPLLARLADFSRWKEPTGTTKSAISVTGAHKAALIGTRCGVSNRGSEISHQPLYRRSA
ncbi:hypothetical protein [Bradyrhizobium sp. SSUT77]|uniref:hypothetical protein n=1 Tax=Bradyrhizobium sp. SSUT77 TaxID=3040603 RepID=UPI00244AC2B6|nr:hypothetical protein [Bradyrhizobium sp. SSUT77]MDH2348134.1 hypothetical protein [Bradyrhizobium sp. SSUT77]